MLCPKVKDPFFRFAMFGFYGGLGGVLAAVGLGLVVGLLTFIVTKIQGNPYSDASTIIDLLQPGMPMGALLGTILGAVFGIVRKDA